MILLLSIGLAFAVVAAVAFRHTRTLVSPAVVWNGVWATAFIASGALGLGYAYDPAAVLVLGLYALIFSLGCLIAAGRTSHISFGTDPAARDTAAVSLMLVWLLLIAAAVGLELVNRQFGNSLLALRSLREYFGASQLNAQLIFSGERVFGPSASLCFAALQLASALLGARSQLQPSRATHAASLAALAIAVLWSVATTQRSFLLVPGIWWASGYAAAVCLRGRPVVPNRAMVKAAIAAIALATAAIFIRAIRVSGHAASLDASTFASARLWFAGYIATFSRWFSDGHQTPKDDIPGFFGGIHSLLGGGRQAAPGAGNIVIDNSGTVSNAPTMMRDVVAVGGPVVAALLMLVLGALAHVAFRRACRGGVVAAAAYACVLAGILWATNAWFFAYGARTLCGISLVALALFARRRRMSASKVHAGRHLRSATLGRGHP